MDLFSSPLYLLSVVVVVFPLSYDAWNEKKKKSKEVAIKRVEDDEARKPEIITRNLLNMKLKLLLPRSEAVYHSNYAFNKSCPSNYHVTHAWMSWAEREL